MIFINETDCVFCEAHAEAEATIFIIEKDLDICEVRSKAEERVEHQT
jgi:hypothetical protein